MVRNSLKCNGCSSNEFDVVQCLVPSGIEIRCSCCGRITPIILSVGSSSFPINNSKTLELFDSSYTRDIGRAEAYNAYLS